MLKPIYTEIAESQESTALVWIETERQRNELLNKARQILMYALADSELIHEKARIALENILLKETSSSERELFNRLDMPALVNQLSAAFLLEMNHLVNLTKTVDVDSLVAQCDDDVKTQQTNDLFDFVPASNVFDLTEFLSILEN
jgi:KaiC/GvpD/RAD55 family RecA-like ATPase